MIPFTKASELFAAKWLIEHGYVMSQLPLLYAFLNGQAIDVSAISADKQKIPFIIKGSDNLNTCSRYDLQYEDIPMDSVAVIPVQGPIMSDDTLNLMKWLQLANDNDNVVAVVLLVNSPGGVVFQIDNLAGSISGFRKPIFTYVVGVCASAAMWICSGSDRIFLSSKMDRIGSIGVMTSFMSMSRMLKDKLGIDVYEFYARKSTEKNQPVRTMMDDNSTPEEKQARTEELLDDLDFTNDLFHEGIMKNMGLKADSPVFTGKIYFAEEAIKQGLAHEINTLQYAIEYAHHQGLIAKINNYKLNPTKK